MNQPNPDDQSNQEAKLAKDATKPDTVQGKPDPALAGTPEVPIVNSRTRVRRLQHFRNWLSDIKVGDIILVIAAFIGLFFTYRQNALIVQGNKTADLAAKAAESSASADQETVKQTKEGEATVQKTAEALATTANAIKAVATENAKTAKATEQVAETTERALVIANEAQKTAVEAANAAKAAANAAEKSNDIATDTAKRQLRAYMHVATKHRPLLILEDRTYRIEAKVRNAGRTPAIMVRQFCDLKYLTKAQAKKYDPAAISVKQGGGISVYPDDEYTIVNATLPMDEARGDDPIVMFGRVEYVDAFDSVRYTNFRYIKGPLIAGSSNKFDMIIMDEGNDSN